MNVPYNTTTTKNKKFNNFPIALKQTYAISQLSKFGRNPTMATDETNIIEFKKPLKSDKSHEEKGHKESNIYDSYFTPELHKKLLEKARKENGSN